MRKRKQAGSFIGRQKNEKRTKGSHIQPSRSPLASGKESRRDLRLDTLRGILLVIMTFVHFPSYIGNVFRQALGYVSAAEGFIFLSAYLFSFVHARQGGNLKDLFMIGSRRAFLIYRYYFFLVLIQFLLVSAIYHDFHAGPGKHDKPVQTGAVGHLARTFLHSSASVGEYSANVLCLRFLVAAGSIWIFPGPRCLGFCRRCRLVGVGPV